MQNSKPKSHDVILDLIKGQQRECAWVRGDWSIGSVNGMLRIDMGIMVTLKSLARKVTYSLPTIRKAVAKLEANKQVSVYREGRRSPVLITLIES